MQSKSSPLQVVFGIVLSNDSRLSCLAMCSSESGKVLVTRHTN